MKKLISAILCSFVASALFADANFRFYNKAFSDTMSITHTEGDYAYTQSGNYPYNYGYNDGDSHTDADFLSASNQVYAELKTERVDAMVKASFTFNNWTRGGYYDFGFKWNSKVDDWYVEYRPTQYFTFGFHDPIYMKGAFLPVYDYSKGNEKNKYLYSGNIGSEGITVVFRPPVLDNALRIAATTPFTETKTNWILSSENRDAVDDSTPNFGAGAIYSVKYFEVGLTVQDIFDRDERTFGSYMCLPGLFGAVENLVIGGGFAYSEKYISDFNNTPTFYDYTYYGGITGEKLFSSYFTYKADKFSIKADLVTNFGESYSNANLFWDLYTGLCLGFNITDRFTITATAKLLTDIDSEVRTFGDDLAKKILAENVYAGAFALTYQINSQNEVEAGVKVDTFDKNFAIRFPVHWKYTF